MGFLKYYSRSIFGLSDIRTILASYLVVAACCLFANGVAVADAVETAEQNEAAQKTLHVMASIRPLQMLVQDLTQGILPVSVDVLVPRNSSPHDYQLTPRSAFSLRNADFVVWLGASAEPYLTKAIFQQKSATVAMLNLPAMHLRHYSEVAVHKGQGDAGQELEEHNDRGHNHDDAHEHSGIDPHFWWSVQHLDVAAQALVEQLSKLRPKAALALRSRYVQWIESLREQRQQARKQLKSNPAGVLTYHDSLFYLQLDLQRELQPTSQLMSQPDVKPGARQLIELRQRVQAQKLQCLILEPGSSLAWISKIDPNGLLNQVTIDPLGWSVDPLGENLEGAEGGLIAAMLRSAYQKLELCLAKKSVTTAEPSPGN